MPKQINMKKTWRRKYLRRMAERRSLWDCAFNSTGCAGWLFKNAALYDWGCAPGAFFAYFPQTKTYWADEDAQYHFRFDLPDDPAGQRHFCGALMNGKIRSFILANHQYRHPGQGGKSAKAELWFYPNRSESKKEAARRYGRHAARRKYVKRSKKK